jgi:hypothetical protein
VIVIVCVSKERGRRVIVKAEYSGRGANSRCVFTNLEVRSQVGGKRGQSTNIDRLNPGLDAWVGLALEVGFESANLLAHICRTAHMEPVCYPALIHRGRPGDSPGETNLSSITTPAYF